MRTHIAQQLRRLANRLEPSSHIDDKLFAAWYSELYNAPPLPVDWTRDSTPFFRQGGAR